jgi:3'-phosphoadenosine 5'-phosphosulfate sulfotransferase (PAPS reductase)/FAD synthetase
MEQWELEQRQALPLEAKIVHSQLRIMEWYEHWGGQVYVSFSGGKDSTVLLDLVRQLYPDVPAVFSDTGLEYPEIKAHVKSFDNVAVVRPRMSFRQVLNTYGYPIVSKSVSRFVNDVQHSSERNRAVVNLRLTGYNQAGGYCPTLMLSQKWRFLVDAPFKVSDYCCDVMKKGPVNKYQRESGRAAIIGLLASESDRRTRNYKEHGCNVFEAKHPQSRPLAIWTEQDILRYIKERSLPLASVYGEIAEGLTGLYTTGEHRTGCIFCGFGIQFDPTPNRFQRMAVTHPKLYDYCINDLGLGMVMDYIGVDYKPLPEQMGLFEAAAGEEER